MYQPTQRSAPSPYGSPPAQRDSMRSPPGPTGARQPYAPTFSPPPAGPAAVGVNGLPPMPPQQQPYQAYPAGPSAAGRYAAGGGRGPGFSNGYAASPPNIGYPAVPPQQTPQQKHKGTIAPGTLVKVGDNTVRVERYLSEGGYAHVYLSTSERPIYPPLKTQDSKRGRWGEKGYTTHCLKRIAFDDENVWIDVRKEIEVMKSLPPNPHLTQYLGSAHSRLPSGGYEVFILMEFCSGGGIIDLLNKRLRDRLKEIEILNIFTDVCEAVAAMHALKQPLLHRDLKIENVLSIPSGQPPSPSRPMPLTFKLCDFGSTTYPATHPPQNKVEAEGLALDLNKNTTLQYRSPEMVEPMLGWAVGLPSDVWALGVLLYKLCYYTTPFEEHGTLAIVNAKYTFPQFPVYSPRLQHLIASMLVDHPARRPTVFEILRTAHEMQGTKPEIDYPTPSRSFKTASPAPAASQPRPTTKSANLLDFTSPTSPGGPNSSASTLQQPSLASTVQPQRRGRPTRGTDQQSVDFGGRAGQEARPSGPGQLPPMPRQPIVGFNPGMARSPGNASAAGPEQAKAPVMQVTGEQPKPQPIPQGSLDAFGMPSSRSNTKSPASGFQDAFGSSTSSSRPGGADKSDAVAGASGGFDDSFGASKKEGGFPALSQKPAPPTIVPNFPTTFESTTSPIASPQAPHPGGEDEELSFEARFPSIETLSMMGNFPAGRSQSQPNTLISPVVSPSAVAGSSTQSPPIKGRPIVQARASIMGNLTGDTSALHLLSHVQAGQAPQPRSTQVTGTAFKGISSGVPGRKPDTAAPSSDRVQSEGYASLDGEEERVLPEARNNAPVDLMGDEADGGGMSMPLMARQTSNVSSSTISSSAPPRAAALQQPQTGHDRPLLPHMNSSKPAYNFNDPQWSPLLRAQGSKSGQEGAVSGPGDSAKEQNIPAFALEPDSSDEDEGPEDASPAQARPTLSQRPSEKGRTESFAASGASSIRSRMAAFENRGHQAGSSSAARASTSPTKRQSMVSSSGPQKATSTPVPGEKPAALQSSRQYGYGSATQARPRPQSMFIPSSSSMSINAPGGDKVTSPLDDAPRSAGASSSTASSLARKPSVAAKPAALRKPTPQGPGESASAETGNAPGAQEVQPSSIDRSEQPDAPPKPFTAKPAVTAKPASLARRPSSAVKHGDMPAVAGYSRSSSGRSFPIHAPTAGSSRNDTSQQNAGVTRAEALGGSNGIDARPIGSSSRSASPEKQQSVNSLIARWNQGQATSQTKPPMRKGGGYV